MSTNASTLRRLRKGALAALCAGGLAAIAACAPFVQEPQATQASNPTVTYRYQGDQELIAANQKAQAFCTRYNAVPRAANIVSNTDGTNSAHFECVPSAQATAALPQPNPSMTYTVRSDQELLQASQSASIYCSNQGRRAVTSNISPNGDGSRTVTFQCTPG